MVYIPALDGIRALAVLIVIGFHSQVPGLGGGYVGVDIFFVLSGFLITSLLLHEFAQTQTVRIGRFYRRRIARLVPALVLLLGTYLALAPMAWPHDQHVTRDVLIAASYLSDAIPAFWQSGSPLRHTWSLSVEQHYYLIWPVIILFIARRFPAKLPQLLFAAYVVSTLWRVGHVFAGENWNMVYFRFDMRLSGLILGSWLAACVVTHDRFPVLSIKWIAPITLLAVIAISTCRWKNPLGLIVGISAAEILGSIMILVVRNPGISILHRIATARSMVYLGKISYGIYLYHFPIIYLLRTLFTWPVVLAVGLALSVALSALSYHTVERIGNRIRVSDDRPHATGAAQL